MNLPLDHLVYGVLDLERGVADLERLLGVRASAGGQHPGRGTHNALLALGEDRYLEIIAPDPGQPAPAGQRSFGLDAVRAPRLLTWAAKSRELDTVAAKARALGVDLGAPGDGGRRTPDGAELRWRYTSVHGDRLGGLVPFFIDWGETPNPARSAVRGVTLAGLRAEHPDPRRVQAVLEGLGISMPVSAGASPALVATLHTPRGEVELR
jgi:hypothetical protein